VLELMNCPDKNALLASLDVEDVWGIGHRHAKRLKERSVMTALDFTGLSRE